MSGSRYACETCGKSFSRLAAKENHERLTHPTDEAIIKASCQQRMATTKKEKPKKEPKKEPKREPKEYGVQRETAEFHVNNVRKSVQYVTQVPVAITSLYQNGNLSALDIANSSKLQPFAGGLNANQNQLSSHHSHNKHPVESIKKVPEAVGAPVNKRLSVVQSKADGKYRCYDCRGVLESVEELFGHDCLSNPSKSELPCDFCGCSGPECSCHQRFIKVFMIDKIFAGAKYKKLPNNEAGGTDSKPPDVESLNVPISTKRAESPMTDVSNKIANNVQETEVDDRSEQVTCPHCKKIFKNDLYLNNHLLSHNELKQFDCYFCRLVFTSGANLKQHLKVVHNHQTEAVCKRPHGGIIKTSEGIRFRCSLCPKLFTCRSNRRRHERWHFGIRPYACDLCGVAFRQRWQLTTHKKSKKCHENRITTINSLGSKLFCDENPSVEYISEQYQGSTPTPKLEEGTEEGEVKDPSGKSLQINQDCTIKSSSSEPTFAVKEEFSHAIEGLPTGGSQGVNYLTQDVKSQFLAAHSEETPLDLSTVKGLLPKTFDGKTYICHQCGKVCKTKRNLMIHKRIHTGERPYSCTLCSLTFRQSHHRKAHMLSRHGVYRPSPKPENKEEIVIVTQEGVRYQCHYCNKALMSKSGRRKHERWHLGLRPHRCNSCGCTFKQRQHLKKHQLSQKCKSWHIFPKSQAGKMSEKENCEGRALPPLTPLHLMKGIKSGGSYKEELLDANGNLTPLPVDDKPTIWDMPSALGLISVEKLKALSKVKEASTETKSSSWTTDPGSTLAANASEADTAYNSTDHESPDSKEQSKPSKSFSDAGNQIKISLEGGKVDQNGKAPTSSASDDAGSLCEMRVEDFDNYEDLGMQEGESSDIEEGEVFDMTQVMAGFDISTDSTAVSNGDLPLNLSCSGTDNSPQSKEDPVQCSVCGQHYKSKQNLNIHMRIHNDVRPYSCALCPKNFIQPHHLKVHMKSRHDVIMVTINNKPARDQEVIMTSEGIRFKCQHCPKLLTSKNGRQKHERWHLGLRPHICDICGKAFKQSHHLKRHRYGKACIPPDQQQPSTPAQPLNDGKMKVMLPGAEPGQPTLSPQMSSQIFVPCKIKVEPDLP